jgi:hypothetical protein
MIALHQSYTDLRMHTCYKTPILHIKRTSHQYSSCKRMPLLQHSAAPSAMILGHRSRRELTASLAVAYLSPPGKTYAPPPLMQTTVAFGYLSRTNIHLRHRTSLRPKPNAERHVDDARQGVRHRHGESLADLCAVVHETVAVGEVGRVHSLVSFGDKERFPIPARHALQELHSPESRTFPKIHTTKELH